MFLVILFWVLLRHVAKGRELSHAERMKALELGQAIGPSESDKREAKQAHNAFWIAFWLGAGVPIAATSAASVSMSQMRTEEIGIVLAIWICAAAISVASVICATILTVNSRCQSLSVEKKRQETSSASVDRH